jgi:hypothetical protein
MPAVFLCKKTPCRKAFGKGTPVVCRAFERSAIRKGLSRAIAFWDFSDAGLVVMMFKILIENQLIRSISEKRGAHYGKTIYFGIGNRGTS